MQFKDVFDPDQPKIRFWALQFSLGFGIIGIFLFFSIVMAFLSLGTFISAPGFFFIQSYGILAVAIPFFLIYAAYLLADTQYKPERIFLLCAGIPPFFTIAFGIYWFRNFDVLRYQSDFIANAGLLGLGFFVFFMIVLQLLVSTLIYFILFKKSSIKSISSSVNSSINSISEEITGMFSADESLVEEETIEEAAEQEAGEQETDTEEELEDGEFFNSSHIDSYFSQDDDESDDPDAPEKPCQRLFIPMAKTEEPELSSDIEKALAEAKAYAEAFSSAASAANTSVEKAAPKRKRGLPYKVPIEGLLKQYPDGEYWIIDDATREAALILKDTFKEFNIQVEVTGIRKGPVITMFEILPAPGIRLAKIENLADNIALRLAAQSVRIVAPIPGKHAVGIEVPNIKRNIVSFREIIEGELKRDGKKLEVPMVLGKDITGEAVTVDLTQMPHLLIAGATGSGKSVCVNSMILSLLYQKSPSECRLILIDPKIVELKLYNDIPHLLTPVITEPKKAFQALQYCIFEMERRYSCLDSMGVRDIRSYNRRIKERNIAAENMPYIVVVIDEFADLMATTGKEMESTVARLAAMSRAVGVHLVLATQRPSIDVITGLIKANIPSRIAFMVASKMDSRIIIDMVGAEKLLGKGDMLYAGAVDPFPIRMQGAFVSEEEVESVVDFVKSLGEPDYIDDEIFYDEEEETDPSLFSEGDDPLYEKALEIVLQQGKASASYIQRRLKIGYNRAARIVEIMEHHGVVGPAQGSKPREVLRGA